VGTTASTLNLATSSGAHLGVAVDAVNDIVIATRASGHGLIVNRTGTDGDIAQFRKDGTTVGSIGTGGGDLYIGTGDTGISFVNGADSLFPYNPSTTTASDNIHSLGGSSNRFKNLYLSGGIVFGTGGAAKTLDDYEEGTFTPTFTAGSGAFATLTMDVVKAQYTKVGRAVHILCYIRTDDVSLGTASGALTITGLPFSSDSLYSLAVGVSNDWTGDDPQMAFVSGTGIALQYKAAISSGSSNISVTDMTTGTNADANAICVTGTYFTNA
jgi:hypothetical protein